MAPLLLLLLSIATGCNAFRVMQYNVEWLFLDYYSPADCPGQGCTWTDADRAETHMTAVADVVSAVRPDLLNICEVEGMHEIDTLAQLSRHDSGKALQGHFVKGTDTATGQNVGLLTSLPVLDMYRLNDRVAFPVPGSTCAAESAIDAVGNTKQLRGASDEGVSKNYVAKIQWMGVDITVFGAHLLAYPDRSDRCVKREAQAAVLADAVADALKTSEVILLGDLNDYDAEVPDKNNNQPISLVLDILKNGTAARPYDRVLRSAAEWVGQGDRYSDWWDKNGDCAAEDGEMGAIDHVLLSPALFDRIDDVFFYHAYTENCDRNTSDHYPLVVDLV